MKNINNSSLKTVEATGGNGKENTECCESSGRKKRTCVQLIYPSLVLLTICLMIYSFLLTQVLVYTHAWETILQQKEKRQHVDLPDGMTYFEWSGYAIVICLTLWSFY